MIPEAYKSIYIGCPCVNIEEILIDKSDSANPKFVSVIGSSNKAEAKIAGITPAVLIFKG